MVKEGHIVWMLKLKLLDWIPYETSFSNHTKINQTLLQENLNERKSDECIVRDIKVYFCIRKSIWYKLINLAYIKYLANHKTTDNISFLDKNWSYIIITYQIKYKFFLQKIMQFATIWMEQDNIMLSEISQKESGKYKVILSYEEFKTTKVTTNAQRQHNGRTETHNWVGEVIR